MAEIPGFWDVGPHEPLPIEDTWRRFVRSTGGTIVDDELSGARTFENADFWFRDANVVAELKEVQTEFSDSPGLRAKFESLVESMLAEEATRLRGIPGISYPLPANFMREYLRLFRDPVGRILKKANRQVRDTKKHFGLSQSRGVLLFVNDGFVSLGPDVVRAIASDVLLHSYSSIDCLVYMTINAYVEVQGSDIPRLVWAPSYSERAPDDLVGFVDDLGRKWFSFLEPLVGGYTGGGEVPNWEEPLRGSHVIRIPGQGER